MEWRSKNHIYYVNTSLVISVKASRTTLFCMDVARYIYCALNVGLQITIILLQIHLFLNFTLKLLSLFNVQKKIVQQAKTHFWMYVLLLLLCLLKNVRLINDLSIKHQENTRKCMITENLEMWWQVQSTTLWNCICSIHAITRECFSRKTSLSVQ